MELILILQMVTKFKPECGIMHYPIPVEIISTKLSDNFCVFPNPVNDELNLKGFEEFTDISVNIINSLGEKVLITDECSKIDTRDFSTGLFIVMVYSENELIGRFKVVKN